MWVHPGWRSRLRWSVIAFSGHSGPDCLSYFPPRVEALIDRFRHPPSTALRYIWDRFPEVGDIGLPLNIGNRSLQGILEANRTQNTLGWLEHAANVKAEIEIALGKFFLRFQTKPPDVSTS